MSAPNSSDRADQSSCPSCRTLAADLAACRASRRTAEQELHEMRIERAELGVRHSRAVARAEATEQEVELAVLQLNAAEAALGALRARLQQLADEFERNGTNWPSPDLRVAALRIRAVLAPGADQP
jgi:chromosome segregation ATPase